jgi:lysophospholipase L1-like esterase
LVRLSPAKLTLGANDCTLPGQIQHVPIDKYKANLKTLVHIAGSTKILLITPAPIISSKWHNFLRDKAIESGQTPTEALNRKPEVTATYREACIQVATELSLPVVDAYQAVLAAAGGLTDQQLDPYFT